MGPFDKTSYQRRYMRAQRLTEAVNEAILETTKIMETEITVLGEVLDRLKRNAELLEIFK